MPEPTNDEKLKRFVQFVADNPGANVYAAQDVWDAIKAATDRQEFDIGSGGHRAAVESSPLIPPGVLMSGGLRIECVPWLAPGTMTAIAGNFMRKYAREFSPDRSRMSVTGIDWGQGKSWTY